MGVSTPSTLMPSGMGVTNPKFVKSVRKPKKTDELKSNLFLVHFSV